MEETPFLTPQLKAAVAVALMLHGLQVGSEFISTDPVHGRRLLPKYETSELDCLRVDVVPGSSATLSRISRGSLSETCPIVIGIQQQCNNAIDDEEYASLLRVLRTVAAMVATTEIEGFGTPIEDVEFRDDPAAVDEEGVFRGVVTTTYQAFA